MAEQKLVYFVSDVHLGRQDVDPAEREARFVSFLKGLSADAVQALYLLGDIWEFWYEYRDVVPRIGARVVAELVRLMDDGVEVCICPGNHDLWTYSFFEELGMHRFEQPYYVTLGGKVFCLGHGDLLGGAKRSYEWTIKFYRSPVTQFFFSLLHPWLAFRIAFGSAHHKRKNRPDYQFKGEEEPIYKFAKAASGARHVDYFIFGHFHRAEDITLPSGAKLYILKDWLDGGMPCAVFNGTSCELRTPASPAE